MKTYSKPQLVALSLSGNDMLCACRYDVVLPNMSQEIQDLLKILGVPNTANPFSTDAGCKYTTGLEMYCKNTPTYMFIVFNS